MKLLSRRTVLASAAATLACPAIAQRARVLRIAPQSNLPSIDPIWTTATVVRNHAFLVYDTLYGLDAELRPQPQMVAGHLIEDDGKRVTLTLRDGLRFHDNTPVLARDAVASIRRWSARNPFGQKLADVTDSLEAPDDQRLVFRLRRPFPLLFNALAAISNACVIMPARVAATDPFKQITDATGSGPFRFKADEFNSGSLVVYERHPGYIPRDAGGASLTAGPKQVFFDRVEWHVITDPSTASVALQQGEIDWFETPGPEILTYLQRNKAISVVPFDRRTNPSILRLNHLHPPFNDPAARRALLPAIVQADFMTAVEGDDPALIRTDVGIFTPDTPLASTAGLDVLSGPRDLDRARQLLRDAGADTPVTRLIGPTDVPGPSALTQVCADLFQRLGLNLDLALSDWGTVVQRRTSREPVEKGGWSAFLTGFNGFDFVDPGGHPLLRGNGLAGWPGWPTIPRLETLRDAWFEAPDFATQKQIAADIQRVALEEVAYIPVGASLARTALKANLVDRVEGFAIFWGIKKA